MTRPPFESAHQALLFAWTFSANQHGTAAAAERRIALFARERYENLPAASTGRGLVGLDGAAQAGMIHRRISTLPTLMQAAIAARFAVLPQDVATRQAACKILALHARGAMPCDLESTVLLMRKLHGLRVDLGRLADEKDVGERTIRRWKVSAWKWLKPVQQRAMDRAEEVLCEAEIVEDARAN